MRKVYGDLFFCCCLYCWKFLFLFPEIKAFRRAQKQVTAPSLFLHGSTWLTLCFFLWANVSVALIQQLHCIIFIGQLCSLRCIPKLLWDSSHQAVWETLMEWLIQMLAEPIVQQTYMEVIERRIRPIIWLDGKSWCVFLVSMNGSSHSSKQDVSVFHMLSGWHADPS